MVGTLYPTAAEMPRYAQLYILVSTEATDQRAQTFQTLKRPLLKSLLVMITEPVRPVDPWTGEAVPIDQNHYPPRNPYPAHFMDTLSIVRTYAAAANEAPLVHGLCFAGAVD